MTHKISSKIGIGLAGLYLLVALFLFVESWNCRVMLCDILLSIWSFPAFFVVDFFLGLMGRGEPSIAYIEGWSSAIDVSAVALSIFGNCCLFYLIGYGVGMGIRAIDGKLR